jgi:hypothetical protein
MFHHYILNIFLCIFFYFLIHFSTFIFKQVFFIVFFKSEKKDYKYTLFLMHKDAQKSRGFKSNKSGGQSITLNINPFFFIEAIKYFFLI